MKDGYRDVEMSNNNNHPLEDGWTLWYQKGLGSRKIASAWLDGLKEILSFDTV
jgi:hypothetical protein